MKARFSRLPMSTTLALLAGGLGFSWTVVMVAPAAIRAIDKPTAENQEPYGAPGDRAHGDVVQMSRRLKGWPTASGKGNRKPCWSGDAIWIDQEPLVRGAGPKHGTTATFWVSETVDKQVFLGRYSTDLWYQDQAGTGAIGFSTSVQQGDNTRFIERIPPPSPGPPGWRVILPGQCVFGNVKPLDDEGNVGKFLVDLPAGQRIYLHYSPGIEGKWVPLEKRLILNGKEAPHVLVELEGSDAFFYRTEQAGRYAITVRRTDAREDRKATDDLWTRFYVAVTWGVGGGLIGCGPPDCDTNCLGEDNDE